MEILVIFICLVYAWVGIAPVEGRGEERVRVETRADTSPVVFMLSGGGGDHPRQCQLPVFKNSSLANVIHVEGMARFGEQALQVPLPTEVPDGPSLSVSALLVELNGFRKFHGLDPVVISDVLMDIAFAHSADMSLKDMVSHDGSDGSTLADRLARATYLPRKATENICAGQLDEHEALQAWIASPDHRERLLQPEFTEIGVAVAINPVSEYQTFWTLVLAKADQLTLGLC